MTLPQEGRFVRGSSRGRSSLFLETGRFERSGREPDDRDPLSRDVVGREAPLRALVGLDPGRTGAPGRVEPAGRTGRSERGTERLPTAGRSSRRGNPDDDRRGREGIGREGLDPAVRDEVGRPDSDRCPSPSRTGRRVARSESLESRCLG